MQNTIAACYDSTEDALKDAIKALGGMKKVGSQLKPDLTADNAANWLRDCLNPERRDKLDVRQVMWILREAAKVGFHSAMDFIAADCGYEVPRYIPVEDQAAELQRQFVESVAQLAQLQNKLTALQPRRAR